MVSRISQAPERLRGPVTGSAGDFARTRSGDESMSEIEFRVWFALRAHCRWGRPRSQLQGAQSEPVPNCSV